MIPKSKSQKKFTKMFAESFLEYVYRKEHFCENKFVGVKIFHHLLTKFDSYSLKAKLIILYPYFVKSIMY